MNKIRRQIISHHFLCNLQQVQVVFLVNKGLIFQFNIVKLDPFETHAMYDEKGVDFRLLFWEFRKRFRIEMLNRFKSEITNFCAMVVHILDDSLIEDSIMQGCIMVIVLELKVRKF